jgi:hypothetical protein
MFSTWVFTVLCETDNLPAIPRFDKPAATSLSTSCSRVLMEAAVDNASSSSLDHERGVRRDKPAKIHAAILNLVVASALVVLLAACGGTSTPAAGGILDGTAQAATLDQVKQGIDDLYTRHPDINSFIVQSVTYTPATRDKVLKICSEGGQRPGT